MKKIMLLLMVLFAVGFVSAQLQLPVCPDVPPFGQCDTGSENCAWMCEPFFSEIGCDANQYWYNPASGFGVMCGGTTHPGLSCFNDDYVNQTAYSDPASCENAGYHWVYYPEFCATFVGGINCVQCNENQDCIDREGLGDVCVDNQCVECETDRDCDQGLICGENNFCTEPNGEPMEDIPEFGSGAIVAVLVVAIVAGIFVVKRK